jgi:predicted GH43/DUF377 family glycosyl hydrolase
MPDHSKILPALLTPVKLNQFVVGPSLKKGQFDSHAIDCPFLFSWEGLYYMTFVGWDGIGYRTGLASSRDLLHWKKEGLILDRGPAGSVTAFNAALTCILRDNNLYGNGTLKKVNGKFVGTYHAYPKAGYESGAAVIGLCFSEDFHHWEAGPVVLRPETGAEWERGGLYKSWLMEYESRYYLFYNAKNHTEPPWIEQTGVAISTDLINWERYHANPIVKVGEKGAFDDLFASDPAVYRYEDYWALFYFGNSTDGYARDGVAISPDLFHWDKIDKILIDVGAPGSIDSQYAHKPALIARDGRLYHFYTAVSLTKNPEQGEINNREIRGISVAFNE